MEFRKNDLTLAPFRNSQGFEDEMDMECLPRPAEPCEDSATLEDENDNDVPMTQISTLAGSEKQGGSAPTVCSLNEVRVWIQYIKPQKKLTECFCFAFNLCIVATAKSLHVNRIFNLKGF